MLIFPAIDLKDGQVVRLYKGDFGTVHQVAQDPLETAQAFVQAGARWIHMVDLDGARDGVRQNSELVRQVAEQSLTVEKPRPWWNSSWPEAPLPPAGSPPLLSRMCASSSTPSPAAWTSCAPPGWTPSATARTPTRPSPSPSISPAGRGNVSRETLAKQASRGRRPRRPVLMIYSTGRRGRRPLRASLSEKLF